jgi:peptidoglycan hydrolase CwlO-like protein
MPEDARAELESLQKKLDALLKRRPEHCSGTDGFVGVHKASPELMAEIEEIEDRIANLKKTLDG